MTFEEKRMIRKMLVAGSMLLVSFSASAQWFASTALGPNKWSGGGLTCTSGWSCDDSAFAFRINGGYRFSPYVAFEVGYTDLGKTKASNSATSSSAEFRAAGPTLGFIFSLPLSERWDLFLRTGMGAMNANVKQSIVGQAGIDGSHNTTQPYVGLGASFKLSKLISFQGSFDHAGAKYVEDVAVNARTVKGSAKGVNAGVTFTF
jgi:OmpA-OmpF porin, OOP family